MKRWWIGAAIAIAACSSSGSSGSSGSASGSSAPPAPPPPPKVALVRCTPAPVVPFDPPGILGNAALQQGGAFASLTGTGDIGGLDDSDIYGGLVGSDGGSGGFGYGVGSGSGGTGLGTIGTGRYGAIGHGRGAHQGHMAVPAVSIGQSAQVGDLDKELVRRYIKRNLDKIEYCYEKRLLVKPKLAGTVTVQFFIDPSGTVDAVDAHGMDADVASCVAGVIKDIEFPKPKDGGGAQVHYPFTFRPSGGTDLAPPAPTAAPVAAAPPPTTPTSAGAWTPFALRLPSDDRLAGAVIIAVQGAVQTRLAAIDTCFGASASGSLRAMLLVEPNGAVEVRAGGLGVAPVERCVAQELAKVHVPMNVQDAVEVACDLSRGPEKAWRVSPDDYDVVDVAHGTPTREPTGDRDVLIVAAPDATGAELHAVADHAPIDHSTMYALRDGAFPPLYLGISPAGQAPARGPARARLQLTLHADTVDVCIPGVQPLLHATARGAALDQAFASIEGACKGARCSDALAVEDREGADAGTLAAVLAKARTLGFTRVVFGGPMDACAP